MSFYVNLLLSDIFEYFSQKHVCELVIEMRMRRRKRLTERSISGSRDVSDNPKRETECKMLMP
jgi:hypothetical protein